jgi:hypothetical protein
VAVLRPEQWPDGVPQWRHGRRTRELDSEHHSTNEKYREGENDMTSSPRAKSEPKRNQGRCAAWRGGRLGLWL